MGSITTRAEQAQAGRVARAVGGYSELIALGGQYETIRRRGGTPRIERTDAGWRVVDSAKKGS